MKAVIQRVSKASVVVDEKEVGKIDQGFVVLLGVSNDDTEDKVEKMLNKIAKLRVFSDENGKMNLSLNQVNGELLVISQFTLFADCSCGNRPSFSDAGKPEIAKKLYEKFIEKAIESGITTKRGVFGADMKVTLINDGPVTIVLEI